MISHPAQSIFPRAGHWRLAIAGLLLAAATPLLAQAAESLPPVDVAPATTAVAPNDPDAPRARALLTAADALFAAHKYGDARDAYAKLLESYPASIPLEQVLITLRELARRYASGEASALHFRRYEMAIDIYQLILRVAPAGQQAPEDLLELARLQVAKGEPELALATYRDCVKRFPLLPQAGSAQLAAARLLIDTARRGDGDGTLIRLARREAEQFLSNFPDDSRRTEAEALLKVVDERQGERLFDLGKFYLRTYSYRPEATRRYLNDVIRAYPNTRAAASARKLLAHVDIIAPAGAPGAVIPGVSPADGGTAPPPPAKPAKPDPSKPLPPKPGDVQKYLLPLEDYSQWLPRQQKAAPKEAPQP